MRVIIRVRKKTEQNVEGGEKGVFKKSKNLLRGGIKNGKKVRA